MNKYIINGKEVLTQYTPSSNGTSSILQIFITDQDLHSEMVQLFDRTLIERKGFMSSDKPEKSIKVLPHHKGTMKNKIKELSEIDFFELRFFEKRMLWVILQLMSEDYHVYETDFYY